MGAKKDAKTKSKQAKTKEIAAPDLPDESQSKLLLVGSRRSDRRFYYRLSRNEEKLVRFIFLGSRDTTTKCSVS
jgi:hypothetical protein